MHMSDALVSAPVAGVVEAISIAIFAVAVAKVKRSKNASIIPLMGVMGAFVFAAQMINFSIPGTGSSGHIVGGVLLAAVLGPWAAFISLGSVLVVQCLLFADGGVMALGCNVFNMGVMACLVAYPLVYRPLIRRGASLWRIMIVSVLTSVVGLELGAFAVTVETLLSGITVLPFGQFLLFMLPIHLLIGVCEGLATGAVIYVIGRYKPDLLVDTRGESRAERLKTRLWVPLTIFAVLTIVLAGSFSWVASSNPDGLEWSIMNITGNPDIEAQSSGVAHGVASRIQESTALMPDYNTSLAGVLGSGAIIAVAIGASCIFRRANKKYEK